MYGNYYDLFVLYFSSMVIYLCSPIFAFGCRRQHEEELKLLEEETARRIEEAIRKNVEEKLNSDEVRLEIERRVAEGVKKLFDDVEAQLGKEKEDALAEARKKEVSRLNESFLIVSPFNPEGIRGNLLIILQINHIIILERVSTI